MKKTKMLLGKMGLIIVGFMSMNSCQEEESGPLLKETGNISLDLSATTAFEALTKSIDESIYKNVDEYTVNIFKYGTEQPVQTFQYKDRQTSITLENGAYTIKAFYGSNVEAASRSHFYVEGSTDFNVQGDEQKEISFQCVPTYGKVKTVFSKMDNYFSDYYVTYSTPDLGGNTVKWAKDDTEEKDGAWYLRLKSSGETVKATIHLVPKNNFQTKNATVVREYDLLPNKAWTLHVSPNYDSKNGMLGISITIDDSTEDIPVDVIIPSEWI